MVNGYVLGPGLSFLQSALLQKPIQNLRTPESADAVVQRPSARRIALGFLQKLHQLARGESFTKQAASVLVEENARADLSVL
jgi:hypothetical protein